MFDHNVFEDPTPRPRGLVSLTTAEMTAVVLLLLGSVVIVIAGIYQVSTWLRALFA